MERRRHVLVGAALRGRAVEAGGEDLEELLRVDVQRVDGLSVSVPELGAVHDPMDAAAQHTGQHDAEEGHVQPDDEVGLVPQERSGQVSLATVMTQLLPTSLSRVAEPAAQVLARQIGSGVPEQR